MPTRNSSETPPVSRVAYDYAVIRIVPRPERGEFINAGVILHCSERKFLGARVEFDEGRLACLWQDADLGQLRENVEVIPRICAAAADAGPIALLTARERFHWLTAPRSSAIQISPVHCGTCESPAATLEQLFRKLAAGVPS